MHVEARIRPMPLALMARTKAFSLNVAPGGVSIDGTAGIHNREPNTPYADWLITVFDR